MTLVDLQPDICMERPSLEGLPALALPDGFTVRTIGVDEGHHWEAVMDSAHGGHYPPGDFKIIMVENYDYDPRRVFVMFMDSGETVATASSWRQHWRWGPGVGYLLFVAVARPYQGRGLGYWMALTVLHDFAQHGLACSILETGDSNLPAIKTYLKLGYMPRLVHPNQGERWEEIFQALGMQPVCYSPLIRPPIEAPHPPRPYPYELWMQNASGDFLEGGRVIP